MVQNDEAWLPEIFAVGEFNKWNWILNEYIEHHWPQERFTFDIEVIHLLRVLHESTPKIESFDWVDQTWGIKQLDAAATHLVERTYQQLLSIHKKYDLIKAENIVVCSGDASVPNWMVRKNGSIVLLD